MTEGSPIACCGDKSAPLDIWGFQPVHKRLSPARLNFRTEDFWATVCFSASCEKNHINPTILGALTLGMSPFSLHRDTPDHGMYKIRVWAADLFFERAYSGASRPEQKGDIPKVVIQRFGELLWFSSSQSRIITQRNKVRKLNRRQRIACRQADIPRFVQGRIRPHKDCPLPARQMGATVSNIKYNALHRVVSSGSCLLVFVFPLS